MAECTYIGQEQMHELHSKGSSDAHPRCLIILTSTGQDFARSVCCSSELCASTGFEGAFRGALTPTWRSGAADRQIVGWGHCEESIAWGTTKPITPMIEPINNVLAALRALGSSSALRGTLPLKPKLLLANLRRSFARFG
eukprot:6467331-Amphidinium_carterae.1